MPRILITIINFFGEPFFYGIIAAFLLEGLRLVGKRYVDNKTWLWLLLPLWGIVVFTGSGFVLLQAAILVFGFIDVPPPGGLESLYGAAGALLWVAQCFRTLRGILGKGKIRWPVVSPESRSLLRRHWWKGALALVVFAFFLWANLPL